MGTMRKRKVSLFDVVDDSSALAKKANGSLNGGNNMTPSIDKWYEKPSHRDSTNFGAEEDSSVVASKRGVRKLMISNIGGAVSITGCCHQHTCHSLLDLVIILLEYKLEDKNMYMWETTRYCSFGSKCHICWI